MINKYDEISEMNTARGTIAQNDGRSAENEDGAATLHESIARTGKSTNAFKTISEVADELGVQQHVLRFWETKFSQVRPLKRGGGRRYYRPEDVQLLHAIHNLLYTEGYTIKGVQKLLRDMGKKKILDGIEVVSVANAPEDTSKKPVQAAVAQPVASPVTSYVPQPVVQPKTEVAQPALAQNKNALTRTQKDTLDGLLTELKEIRNLIKE